MDEIIEVHYKATIKQKDFDKLYKYAKLLGHDHGDAGPKETVRRLLMCEGLDCFENESPGSIDIIKIERVV